MADSEIRQRKPQAADSEDEDKPVAPKVRSTADIDESSPLWIDGLRVITFLLLASWVLSYLVTGGESGFWGLKHKPKFMQVDWWKTQLNGPIYLTPEQLAAHDGSDESKPLYLAINGTIYDVSNGRHMYGPGGSYRFFAGCDASRAYVTGCFADDRTPDMRGVEEMFLPIEDPETNKHWTSAQLEELRAQELEQAKERVHTALKHWADFFANSKKYNKVGYVKREKDWLEKLPKRELCAAARKQRPKRKVPAN